MLRVKGTVNIKYLECMQMYLRTQHNYNEFSVCCLSVCQLICLSVCIRYMLYIY